MKSSFCLLVAFLLPLLASDGHAALIHHYRFDTDVADSAGAAAGVLIGGAVVSAGTLQLDGVDDFVQFTEHLIPTSGSYSVALFAKAIALQSGYFELISQGFSGDGFFIGRDFSTVIRGSDAWIDTGVPYPQDLNPHHFALVVDAVAGDTKLYVDGILEAMLGVALTTTANGGHTRLGRQFEPFDEYFHGEIDDVRIYDEAISATTIAALAAPVPLPATLLFFAAALPLLDWRRRQTRAASRV